MTQMVDFKVTLANRKPVWDLPTWDAQVGDTGGRMTAAEMLDAAGLAGWDVRKQLVTTEDGIVVPGKYATVRSTDRKPLGIVGEAYNVLQMEEAFGFGDLLVDDGNANWERGGELNGGSVAFGCLEFTHLGITVPGDDNDGQMKPYLLIVNSFDGTFPYMGKVAFVHPRCTNTFEMATKGAGNRFRIRHSSTLNGQLARAREALGFAFEHVELVSHTISAMALKKVVDTQVQAIFDSLWPTSEELPEARKAQSVATKVYELYQTSPTVEPIRGTAWGAFNAVTEYIDHVAEYKAGSRNQAADVKASSIILGSAEMNKRRALELLAGIATTK